MPFSSLGLSPRLVTALSKLDFQKPYPIQEKVIPEVLMGKDVLGIAQTGSGKTASYVLPVLSLLEKKETKRNRAIEALVVVPTRELAQLCI
ncbi:MAG: DEAD/DEAH box helicase [Cryomorphaceae bacterium]|jgi:ATP-dependent RNA helicase RhlE|nr:DEAD/DEAH box helicase [Cryomorphaceae bacterium]